MESNIIYAWPPATGLASSSPFCLKAIYAAKYLGVPFKTKIVGTRMPTWVKRGKLPVAEFGATQIEDSSQIMWHLDQVSGGKLYGVDEKTKAANFLLEEWCDEFFERFAPYYRWTEDKYFAPFANDAFGRAPFFVRKVVIPAIRKSFVKLLNNETIGSGTEQERLEIFKKSLFILEQQLGPKKFLVSESPMAADFSIYPTIKILLNTNVVEVLPALTASKPLMAWVKRMDDVLGVKSAV
jgi:glutathione S-transferase